MIKIYLNGKYVVSSELESAEFVDFFETNVNAKFDIMGFDDAVHVVCNSDVEDMLKTKIQVYSIAEYKRDIDRIRRKNANIKCGVGIVATVAAVAGGCYLAAKWFDR